MLEKQVSEARAIQIQEKEDRKLMEIQEAKYYDHLWEQDRLKKIEREETDRANRKIINENMMMTLNEQLCELKLSIEREQQLKKEESILMVQTLISFISKNCSNKKMI